MSPDPPENHKGTAASVPAREEPSSGTVGDPEAADQIGLFFDVLEARSDRWKLAAAQRKRLTRGARLGLDSGRAGRIRRREHRRN